MSQTVTTPPVQAEGKKKHLNKVAGPVLLWGIGVGAVISGDYYGWNAGLGSPATGAT